MRDGEIDYSRYTFAELQEALGVIDKNRYPKNYARLIHAYDLLKPANYDDAASTTANAAITDDMHPAARYDEHGKYIPNQIPSDERIQYFLYSIFLLGYGSYGVWVNDLYLPGRRSGGIHLHDVPAWIMYGAIICATLVMVSVIADHYDQRDNERHYRDFAEALKVIGWVLFAVSLLFAIFR